MKAVFEENRTAALIFSGLMTFLLVTSVLQACQLQDIIKFDVPPAVAEAVETEEKVPVSQSEAVWEDWQTWVDRQSDRLAKSIGDSQERLAVIESLTEMGLRLGQDAASTVPGGAFISAALAGLGGLFLRRPGDKKREQMEKEASYRAGLDKGQRIAVGVEEAIEALRSQGDQTNGPEEV